MPANALIQTWVDEEIKQEATVVLKAMGLTVSDAVRLLLTRVARERALPFDPFLPNEITIAAMKEARRDRLATFNSVEDLLTDLNAEG